MWGAHTAGDYVGGHTAGDYVGGHTAGGLIILNTKATPTHHHPISISSSTLNSHCVIALALIIIGLSRDRMKLMKRKGRAGCESQYC